MPVLVRYDNTITGPTTHTQNEELTLLLFSELVADVLTSGMGECLLKKKYPWLCDKSRDCVQGSRLPITSSVCQLKYWCWYARGLVVLRGWLFGSDIEGDVWSSECDEPSSSSG